MASVTTMNSPVPAGQQTAVPRGALLALTAVTGIVDAVSYLGLGRVFVANMTGNVVFLGFSFAGAPGLSVTASATAIAAFFVGALLGGRLAHCPARGALLLLRDAVAVQTALVAAATVLAASSDGSGVAGTALIVLLGVAMGLQNAAARTIGLPDLTTTVLTLTLASLAADSRLAGGKGARPARKLTAVATMLLGALAGGLLHTHGRPWLALSAATVVLLAVTAVLARLAVGARATAPQGSHPGPVRDRDATA